MSKEVMSMNEFILKVYKILLKTKKEKKNDRKIPGPCIRIIKAEKYQK